MQALERLLTVEDVCDLFRFKKSYVYYLTHRGEIPHFKIGNHVRFRQSELESWLADRAQDINGLSSGEEARYHAHP